MGRLLEYLENYGILLCNTNPELPALEDIGCTWGDVTALIDRQELFYCKAFKKRTTYLSRRGSGDGFSESSFQSGRQKLSGRL